jgi:hypothetical protein
MRLYNYITEEVIPVKDFNESLQLFDKAIKSLNRYSLMDEDVVWRGFNMKPNPNIIMTIANNREGWKGKIDKSADSIIQRLNLDSQPVFVTRSHGNARFFGSSRIFVPLSPFKTYYNELISDIMHIDGKVKPDVAAKGYIESINEFPNVGSDWHEMIVTCDQYYLINANQMLATTAKSKFGSIKTENDIKTYGDVVKLYNEYVSYSKWQVKKRLEDRPDLLSYYKDSYPKEWLKV